jgi:hypothetical protein
MFPESLPTSKMKLIVEQAFERAHKAEDKIRKFLTFLENMKYNNSMKEITPELYEAFVKVHKTEFEDEEVYEAYEKLAKDFLGDKAEDGIEQGKLVVSLTRALIEVEGDWVKDGE